MRVAGACVRMGQCPPAHARIDGEQVRRHRLELGGPLPVPELPHVEIAFDAVEARRADPPEEDVTCGLHQPLALDDTPAVVGVRAATRVRLEYRLLRFLYLKEQR